MRHTRGQLHRKRRGGSQPEIIRLITYWLTLVQCIVYHRIPLTYKKKKLIHHTSHLLFGLGLSFLCVGTFNEVVVLSRSMWHIGWHLTYFTGKKKKKHILARSPVLYELGRSQTVFHKVDHFDLYIGHWPMFIKICLPYISYYMVNNDQIRCVITSSEDKYHK